MIKELYIKEVKNLTEERSEINEEIARLDIKYGHTGHFYNSIFFNWTKLDIDHYKKVCKRNTEIGYEISRLKNVINS
tara:strand:+ start:28 stop:258 length:231 start_codon:yes stop_codon:yes gene_type:complete